MSFLLKLFDAVDAVGGAIGSAGDRLLDGLAIVEDAVVDFVNENPKTAAVITTAVGGAACFVAAPAIAAFIGSTGVLGAASTGAPIAGLSGAALQSASLAKIAGGAIAAGGQGMVGGTAIITAAGTATGGASGAAIVASLDKQS